MLLAGELTLKVNGVVYWAKGNFTYNLGYPKREPIFGANGEVQGYKNVPQEPMIEGEITDHGTLKLKSLLTIENATATLDLANGKSVVYRQAWYSGDGSGSTDEANINFRMSSRFKGEEVR